MVSWKNTLLALSILACGGRSELDSYDIPGTGVVGNSSGSVVQGDPTIFVGTWQCTAHVTGAFNDGPAPVSVTEQGQMTITANSDGSLSVTQENQDGSHDACSTHRFNISGSTASPVTGHTCTYVDSMGYTDTETIQSGSFTVSGSSGTLNTVTTVSSVGGFSGTDTLSGTCTRVSP